VVSRKGQQNRRSYDRELGLRFDRQIDDVRVRVVTDPERRSWAAAISTDEELADIGTIRHRRIPTRPAHSAERWLAYTPDGKPSVITKTRKDAAEMLLAVWKEARR
jgi:hypothetical protein